MQTIYLVSRRVITYTDEMKKSLMTAPDWAYVKEGDILYKHGANGTTDFKVLKTAYPINNDLYEMLVDVLGEPVMADGVMNVKEFTEENNGSEK